MKKFLLPLFLFAILSIVACGDDKDEPLAPVVPEQPGGNDNTDENPDNQNSSSLKIKITIGNQIITATMEDNAATHDLLSRLPLEVTLNDFNNTTEKIFHPNPPLNIDGVTRGFAPIAGDIAIYVPWNNIGIFCKNWSYSNDLIKIGHIDGNGIEVLAAEGDLKVKFERQ